MDTLSNKCMDNDTVGSFCDCIGKEEAADPAARAFCTRAKTDPDKVTGDDLLDLKIALMDFEDDACCDC